MVEEEGTVIRSDGEALIIAVLRSSACQSCRARQGCGQAVLSGLGDAETQAAKNHFSLPPRPDLRAGDRVRLGIPEDTLALAAVWMYLWPLLAAFSALLLTASLGLAEPVQLMLALLAGGLALGLTRRRFAQSGRRWEPRLLAVLPNVKTQVLSVSQPVGEP